MCAALVVFAVVKTGHACSHANVSMEAAEAVAAMLIEAKKAREQRHRDLQAAAARTADFRTEKQERRKHGLIRRHALKLARKRPGMVV